MIDSGRNLSNLRIGQPWMGTTFASMENFNLAKKWLTRCLNHHSSDKCPPLQDSPFPTRLVDVGCRDCPRPARIVNSAGQKGKYVALSHCWGGDVPLKTTEKLLGSYTQSLPVKHLPRNFRDAMRITSELGFRYLW